MRVKEDWEHKYNRFAFRPVHCDRCGRRFVLEFYHSNCKLFFPDYYCRKCIKESDYKGDK